MDNLLKQNPGPLADEKQALYGLMDRFITSVENYRKEYNSLVAQKKSDMKNRENSSNSSISKLIASQTAEIKSMTSSNNSALSRIDNEISSATSKASSDLRAIEDDVTSREKNKAAALQQFYDSEKAKQNERNEVRRNLHESYELIGIHMGETWTGTSKLENFISKQQIDSTVSSLSEARDALTASVQAEARAAYEELNRIDYSAWSKLIHTLKRDELIKSVATSVAKADVAIEMLENELVREYKKRQSQNQSENSAYRTKRNKDKESVINNRDRYIAGKKQEREKTVKTFIAAKAQKESAHAKKLAEQKKYFADQLQSADANWDDQILKLSLGFLKKMEEDYPSARMQKWMIQFWKHPRAVTDYSQIDSTQMNVLLGAAEVNVSHWLDGGSAAPIRKVLSNYQWLFGTDKQTAVQNFSRCVFLLPYTMSIENGDSILLSHDEGMEERAKAIVNSTGMRLLRSVPATLMRFQLFDAHGIGAFGRLMALDPANDNNPSEPTVRSIIIGEEGKIHSTDIGQQIYETKILMDGLATQLTSYNSIREFNERNPLSRQIYRPVLMMNFPAGLKVDDIKTLSAMSKSCRKWGFSMVIAQPDKERSAVKPEFEPVLNELYSNVTYLRMSAAEKGLTIANPRSLVEKASKIYLYGLPADQEVGQIKSEIRAKSVEASSVKINFAEAKGICPQPNEMYAYKAGDGIVVPVGYLDGGQPFRLQFDDKHVHTIILGKTGSGKTNLLHVLMTNTMMRYDPSEVMIYLIDFKHGVDFRIYTQYNLPNFRSISVSNEPEFALAMLEHLETELKSRSARMGTKYQKISDYNADHPNNKMNRILLIVDELYELVTKAPDEIHKKITDKLDSFAHQTRAFGLHMVISGQDLDKIDSFETIKNQCTTRLALHCEDEQVKQLMSDDGVTKMHSIESTDQGACVFSVNAGKNPQTEHTALLTGSQQDGFLTQIHNHYLQQGRMTGVKVLLTRVEDNPNHPVQMFVTKGYLPEPDNNKMYVGDPVSLDRELFFHPQGNVWIAGGSLEEDAQKAGGSLLLFMAVSLAMQKAKTGNMDILCTNFADQPMRSIEDEENDRFGQLTASFPNAFQYSTGAQFEAALHAILNELDERRSGAKSSAGAVWWFIVKPEIGADKNITGNTVIDLKDLLQNGPAYNIHTVIWNSDVKKAQTLQLTRTLFKERICLEMTPEESKIINGEELKPMPSAYKAALIGQNTSRFRIYDLPDGQWMNNLFDRMNSLN